MTSATARRASSARSTGLAIRSGLLATSALFALPGMAGAQSIERPTGVDTTAYAAAASAAGVLSVA